MVCLWIKWEVNLISPNTVIRKEGMEALIAALGYVDAERLITLISSEPFDYTVWSERNLDQNVNIRELSKKAADYSKTIDV